MGLKLLHTADWHLGSLFASFPEELRHSLRAAQQELPEKIGQVLRREDCRLALLAGDIFEGNPSRELTELVKAELESWAVPVFIAPGNHDPVTSGSVWQGLWPENVFVFRGDPEWVTLPELDCHIWGAGYRSMDCPGLLEGFRSRREGRTIGLLHGDAVGASSPCCPVTGGQVEQSGLDYLALGHIHKAGSFRRGRTLCAWPGCPMGRGWDETGDKGVYLAELGETASVTWHSLPGPRFQDRTVTAQTLREALPPGGSDDFFRLTLVGEPFSWSWDRGKYPNLFFRDRTRPEGDLWAPAGEDSLEGALFARLKAQLDSAQGRERERILLAAKLCRQILEGREVEL